MNMYTSILRNIQVDTMCAGYLDLLMFLRVNMATGAWGWSSETERVGHTEVAAGECAIKSWIEIVRDGQPTSGTYSIK